MFKIQYPMFKIQCPRKAETGGRKPAPVFHGVEHSFPWRGKFREPFSMAWKKRADIFHRVEIRFPRRGKPVRDPRLSTFPVSSFTHPLHSSPGTIQ